LGASGGDPTRLQHLWFQLIRDRALFDRKIPLAETDGVEVVAAKLTVRCDECGKEYLYKLSEVLRYQIEVPASFVPHPLFREWLMDKDKYQALFSGIARLVLSLAARRLASELA
jgi:hypothetical protein